MAMKRILFVTLALTSAALAYAGLATPNQEYVLRYDAPHQTNAFLVPPALNLGAIFTVEAWVWPEVGDLDNAVVLGRLGGAPFDLAFRLKIRFLDRRVAFDLGFDPSPSTLQMLGTTSLPLQTWSHLAATSDGATVRLYVDGVEEASAPFPGGKTTNAATPFVVGGAYGGLLARARVWSKALTAGKVATSAQTDSPIDDTPLGASGVVVDWPMNDGYARVEGVNSGGPFQALDLGPNEIHQQIGSAATDQDNEPGWALRAILEDPAFQWARTTIPAPSHIGRQALLDVDADGDLDLLLTRSCSSFLNVPPYCNGTPTPSVIFRFDEANDTFVADPTLLNPDNLQLVATAFDSVIADFTGDSRNDVLVSTAGIDNFFGDGVYGGDRNRLLVQQPGGGLVDESSTRLPANLASSERIVHGDVDDDSDLDFFVEKWQGIGVELCTGPFPPPQTAPCSGWHMNDGTGEFVVDFTRMPSSALGIENPKHPALLDLDGDGDLDMPSLSWIGYGQPWMHVWQNDGEGQFARVEGHDFLPRKPDLAWHWSPFLYPIDFDGDGVDDLFGPMEIGHGFETPERFDLALDYPANSPRLVLLRRPNPTATFEDVSHLIDRPAFQAYQPQFGDLDGDGDPDVLIPANHQIQLFLTTALGGLRRAGRVLHSGNGAHVSVGDIDDDGDLDVVAATSGNIGSVIDLHLNPGIAPLPSTVELLAAAPSTRSAVERDKVALAGRKTALRPPATEGSTTLGDGPTGWVVSPWERALYAIDLGAEPPELSGPFLDDVLGVPGLWLGGIDTVPGRRAIGVADQRFQRGWLSLIDVSNPVTPVVEMNADQNFSGDLAISATADLGFKAGTGLFSIRTGNLAGVGGTPNDLANWQGHAPAWPAQGSIDFATSNVEIACVAIAPDRRTAVFCDQKGNRIVFGDFQFGGLEPTLWLGESSLPTSGQPQNIAIGPDGTVLVALAMNGSDAVDVFRVTAPGVVVAGSPATIHGLPGNQQSIVIEPGGTKAWVLSVAPSPDALSRLTLSGPGVVALDQASILDSPNDALDGWLVGIDALAIDPGGEKLVVGGASSSVVDTQVAVIDLDSLAVTVLDAGVVAPTGVAIVPGRVVFRDGFQSGNYCAWTAPTAGCL
jgi:hypothetical protein